MLSTSLLLDSFGLTFLVTGSLTGKQSRAGLSLCCCSQGGMYLLQLLDHHVCSGTTLLLLALCQSISIGWVYGESLATQPSDMLVTRQTKPSTKKS